jgi:hypothetical protein
VHQVLSREEVAALLQGAADAASNRQKPGSAKKAEALKASLKAKADRKVQRGNLAGLPR